MTHIETCIRRGCDKVATHTTANGAYCDEHPSGELQGELTAYTPEQLDAFEQGRRHARAELIELVCHVAQTAPFKSCAHLAHSVREACEELSLPEALVDEIEDQVGVSLEPIDEERQAWLRERGML